MLRGIRECTPEKASEMCFGDQTPTDLRDVLPQALFCCPGTHHASRTWNSHSRESNIEIFEVFIEHQKRGGVTEPKRIPTNTHPMPAVHMQSQHLFRALPKQEPESCPGCHEDKQTLSKLIYIFIE